MERPDLAVCRLVRNGREGYEEKRKDPAAVSGPGAGPDGLRRGKAGALRRKDGDTQPLRRGLQPRGRGARPQLYQDRRRLAGGAENREAHAEPEAFGDGQLRRAERGHGEDPGRAPGDRGRLAHQLRPAVYRPHRRDPDPRLQPFDRRQCDKPRSGEIQVFYKTEVPGHRPQRGHHGPLFCTVSAGPRGADHRDEPAG